MNGLRAKQIPIALAFFVLSLSANPVSAQATTAPATEPSIPLRIQLFGGSTPPPTGTWTGSLKTSDLWVPSASESEVPRWTIGRTATFTIPKGVAFSAGFWGRRGDPLPLYLSDRPAASNLGTRSIVGCGTYRVQWDLAFGVQSPTVTVGRVKVRAFGDLFLPLTPRASDNPATSILNSRAKWLMANR